VRVGDIPPARLATLPVTALARRPRFHGRASVCPRAPIVMPNASHTIPGYDDPVAELERAIVDVAENLFYSFVERCNVARFHDLVSAVREAATNAALSPAWIHARIAFVGPFGGHVDLFMPELLGAQLLSSFTGMPPEQAIDDGQLMDISGEFGNMVSGHWLRAANVDAPFDLAAPSVERLPSTWTPSDDDASGDVHVALSEMPLRVRVSVQAVSVAA